MAKITDEKADIAKLDVRKQKINIPATSTWLNLLNNEYNIVQDVVATLKRDKDGKYILRGDVMDSSTSEEMIVRALIWAFPLGNYNIRGIRHILNGLKGLSVVMNGLRNKDYSSIDFHQQYINLIRRPWLGPSSVSMLLYFFNVRLNVGGNIMRAVAVTNPMKKATNHFDELQNFSGLTYVEQVKLIHNAAKEMKVDFDQLELFLHEY